MQPKKPVSVKRLREEKYSKILGYPIYDLKETEKRLRELRKLGVKAIEFTGKKKVFDIPVLGKGYVGIVVVAHTDNGKNALKIRRVDADRAEMRHEAEMLRRTNAINIGPKLLNFTENFLLIELVEGTLLPQWVRALSGREPRLRIRRVLRAILEKCYRLDEAGIDHGELSRAPKHIIVDADDHAHLVDFETASINRRVSNVTSVSQYLFIGSQIAKTIRRKLIEVNEKELIKALRDYKQHRTQENFKGILEACTLQGLKTRVAHGNACMHGKTANIGKRVSDCLTFLS
ncbi:MAG: serine/threonine protein kinase [Candidatus Bathyarchaeota archaeon]|nr:MAG: serine/threonine protein kinase [Candidatus Bathyarchaeota archaeon]